MLGNDRLTAITIRVQGQEYPFQIFDNALSREISRGILEGKTYPRVNCIRDVRTVLDVGANVGAASAYFALAYPEATLFALEPSPASFRLLQRNLAPFPRVRTFNFGLFDRDATVPLYLSKEDEVTNSVGMSVLNTSRSVEVRLRNARAFVSEQKLDSIDILKVDTEGCELPILRSLADILPRTRVVYLEYHDEADRVAIDALLQPTHILCSAKLRHPHRGELCYVNYNSFPSAEALDRLRIRGGALPSPADVPGEALPSPAASGRVAPALCDVAVVIPTVLRPSLRQAVQSVFNQTFSGAIQVLIGVDKREGGQEVLEDALRSRPGNVQVMVFDPGYSTSVRHGGLHEARDGGALRTILSYAANSRFVAYLDDDNWWAEDHLSTLLEAIRGHQWAYSLRWFVEPQSSRPVCVDDWESVGPAGGIFREQFGGFVDPSTLMIDKVACEPLLRFWSIPLQEDAKGMSADRNIFHLLRRHYSSRPTGRPTCFYRMNPQDPLHPLREQMIARKTDAVLHPPQTRG